MMIFFNKIEMYAHTNKQYQFTTHISPNNKLYELNETKGIDCISLYYFIVLSQSKQR